VDSGSTKRRAKVMENEAHEKRERNGAHTRFAVMLLLPSSKEEALNTSTPTTRGYRGADWYGVCDVVVQ
jgi:hypothetical protein